MLCPKCTEKMLEGFIPTPAIVWIPVGGKRKLIYKNPKEEGFRMGRWRQQTLKEQPAWYCPKCDMIIIDCKDIVD